MVEGKEAVMVFGVLVAVFGFALMAYSVEIMRIRIYPYQLVGAIIILVGVGLAMAGYAIPSQKEGKIEVYTAATSSCPKCGKDLSTFPADIMACPYCGERLSH